MTIVAGFASLAVSLFRRGDQRYLTHGIAAAARITCISCSPSLIQNGIVARRAFDVGVDIHKYEDLLPIHRVIRVFDMPSEKALRKELTLPIGGWVTVVYLKSDFEKTLRLFDCLDARLTLGLFDWPTSKVSTWNRGPMPTA